MSTGMAVAMKARAVMPSVSVWPPRRGGACLGLKTLAGTGVGGGAPLGAQNSLSLAARVVVLGQPVGFARSPHALRRRVLRVGQRAGRLQPIWPAGRPDQPARDEPDDRHARLGGRRAPHRPDRTRRLRAGPRERDGEPAAAAAIPHHRGAVLVRGGGRRRRVPRPRPRREQPRARNANGRAERAGARVARGVQRGPRRSALQAQPAHRPRDRLPVPRRGGGRGRWPLRRFPAWLEPREPGQDRRERAGHRERCGGRAPHGRLPGGRGRG